MIYTVTLNPSLDYIIRVDEFKTGSLNRTSYEQVRAGGKGVNVSGTLAAFGRESVALGFIAGFTGEALKAMIREKKFRSDFIDTREGMTRINVKMLGNPETEINGQGPKVREEDLYALLYRLDSLEPGDILVLSGSIPSSLPEDTYQRILKRLKGKGVLSVVDTAGKALCDALEYHPFLVKPNHHELGELFGVELHTPEDAVPYAKELRKQGARNVLVSLGGEGALFVSENDQVWIAEAPEGKVVNAIGAGDSMVAGFLHAWLATKDLHEAFLMAVACGSAAAFTGESASEESAMALREAVRER